MRGYGTLLLVACSLLTTLAVPADFPLPGEWPCFRRDGGLTARSPASGRISEPHIVWKQSVVSLRTECIAEREQGAQTRTFEINDALAGNPEFAQLRKGFYQDEPS